ncbi:hypothetical protein BDR04DRAFT_1149540 [Suillus decipiens]|nr:hypothetical protein BDR04DRAFT_1149540 [Suillus decipiens]
MNDLSDCPRISQSIYIQISGNFIYPPLVFTRVTLLGGNQSLIPSLPCLLQGWLARSGNQPLTLRINRIHASCHLLFSKSVRCRVGPGYKELSQADSRLLEILQSESKRWEIVVSELHGDEWPSAALDTPQLRTLECSWSGLNSFNAPNLHRLHILNESEGMPATPIPICKNLRHLHLQYASPTVIRSISVTYPLLETIVVLGVNDCGGTRSHSVTYSCLESLTLPLPWYSSHLHWFTEIFDGLHVPMLRKLTLVGYPPGSATNCIMAGLAVAATCNLQVIDFQMPQIHYDKAYEYEVEDLLSVAKEISICSELVICRD